MVKLGFYLDKADAIAAAKVWFSKGDDSLNNPLKMYATSLEKIIETQQKKYDIMKSNYLQLAAEQGGEIWTAANRLVADNNKNKVEDLPKPKVDVREKAPVYVPLRGAAANVNWDAADRDCNMGWQSRPYLDSVNGFDT